MFNQALAIGATGMLADALNFVREASEHTLTVARYAQAEPPHQALRTDYRDHDLFFRHVHQTLDIASVDFALLWIHETGNAVTETLLRTLSRQPCLIVHVLGSATGDPSVNTAEVRKRYNMRVDCTYITVTLGAILTPKGMRWLTHEEISAGVIHAIKNRQDTIVGTLNF